MRILPGYLDSASQKDLLMEIQEVIKVAPCFHPVMPRTGKPFSVLMTNCGELGWITDKAGGYRYQKTHPVTGRPWPAIPGVLSDIWQRVANHPAKAEACLINLYRDGARMGLHQDRDEADFTVPVVSISLGDRGLFRIGGTNRRDPTRSVWLSSGDVIVLEGDTRLAFHGIDRTIPNSSPLVPGGGRINLTMRRVSSI